MHIHRRVFAVLAGLVLVAALPGAALANTTEAIADTGGMTLVIPGVPVTVGVTLDDFGNISSVEISDDAFVSTKDKPGKLRFARDNEDGSTVIDIRAKGSKLSTKLKTTNLDDVLGVHEWTADIFDTGVTTTVRFTVAQAGANGFPYAELTDVDVTSPYLVGIEGPNTEIDDDDGEEERKSKAQIEFAFDGYRRTLKIEVKSELDDDDGGVKFSLKVELKGKDQRELFGEDALGAHTWQGLLCDGTTATVNYTVAVTGITVDGVDVAEGVTFDIKENGNGFKVKVKFTDTDGNHRAYFKAHLHDKDGALHLKVKSKTTNSCKPDKKNDEDHDKKKKNDDDRGKKEKKNDDD